MSDEQPITEALAALQMVNERIPVDHLVAGALVVFKIIDEDGDVYLRFNSSTGLAVFERIGMLRSAEAVEVRDMLGADR